MGFGYRVLGFGVGGSGFRVPGFGIWDLGSGVCIFGFGIFGFGFKVLGGKPCFQNRSSDAVPCALHPVPSFLGSEHLVGGVNHCRLHCRLAKSRGLMRRVKYGAVIGQKTRFFVCA